MTFGPLTWRVSRPENIGAGVETAAMAKATTRLLSARQAEIASLVAAGKSNREIAKTLFVAERTVETHITAIYTKLEVRSRTELTATMLQAPTSHDDGSASPVRSNLPVVHKRLVGRDEDCARISAALDAHALVTITGAGGMGKTRIALEIGGVWQRRMRDGAWFVDLGPQTGPLAVSAAITQALRAPESRNVPLLASITTFLRAKRLLLILDNCEHLIAQAAAVADEILRACPYVLILATSREPLRVGGEGTYRLPPLNSPDAIALFTERAASRNFHWTLDDGNRPVVAEICTRLDGIPLALELAAARVGMLSIEEIAANLDRRFALLRCGERNALPRHQTMRALLDWSYDLLDAPERRLFAQLAVFADGCSLAAATAVCRGGGETPHDLFDVLSSLVDKSLVIVDMDVNVGESRYRLLESSRIYAREKLNERGEAQAAVQRHAHFYTELAEAHERAYATDLEPAWRNRSERELENWRAALRWSLTNGGDATLGQRLAGALGPVWRHFAYAEGRAWVRLARESAPPASAAINARLAYAQAGIALGFLDYETALRSAREALETFEKLGDPLGIARARYIVGHSELLSGDARTSAQTIRAALDAAQFLGDTRLTGLALESLAIERLVADDPAGARALFRDALSVFHTLAAERNATLVAVNLAEAEFKAGNARTALDLALTALPSARKLNPHFVAAALGNIAAYLIALERYDEAGRHALEAYELSAELQLDVFIGWALQRFAAIAALHHGRYAAAARLLGYIDARLTRLAAVRRYTEEQEYDRIRERLRGKLDDAELAALRDAGAVMNDERAFAQALEAAL